MKREWTKVIKIILGVIVFLAVMVIVAALAYQANFGNRITTAPMEAFSVAAFEGLRAEECRFPSDKGQMLAGWKYSREGTPKALVVFAHGYGAGGQIGYVDFFDRLTQEGYAVFAYDATGNDKSEGKGVGGLPQGVADLHHALQYVRTVPEYKDLPVLLTGYSWGAYSTGNVLNFVPDVQGAVMVAGFDRSIEMFVLEGRARAGKAADILRPFVRVYELLKFGRYAAVSAISGFEKSDAPVMVIQGSADQLVTPALGYDKFYEKYGGTGRVAFMLCPGKTHDILRLYNVTEKSLEYGLNEELMQAILAFYDTCLMQTVE